MKIIIQDEEENVVTIKDLDNMDNGLAGQVVIELELLKKEILEIYSIENNLGGD